jgi:tRNA threonylcarbamoyladenosine biosynthesis protein TsaB
VLVLAFDTATDVATSALVHVGEHADVLGERASRAVRILEDVDDLLAEAGLERTAIEGIVVGTGPGSYTGLRMGIVTARALAFALDAPVAGVSRRAPPARGR